ncbi:DMT family transporter [Jatrophihabitans telluris]|uniref:DMT family transporter n=1 Tax=Jatrophihabitans telluris TaxID=2038343 RepID=A0ABY4QSW4_9ACTN|nr:DMT family transporter [Jatrophihabitans telluris]UQX86868.1 DMT family transporter [Jatrophihabitans telluris]
MGVNWLVVGLSVSAALAFAVSTTLKKASASQVPKISGSGVRGVGGFLGRTVSHPLWLGGLLADGAGLALQVTALHLGALAVVQPLLVSGLLFALVLRHRHDWVISAQEVLWAGVLVSCLIAFLALSGSVSNSAQPSSADHLPAALAALAGVLTAGLCLSIARRRVPAGTRAALIGVAVGAVFAGTAALIKAATNVLTLHGPWAVLSSWQLYAVLALGGIGLVLTQLAFQAGPLTASLPAISTVDPLLSVAIGVLVYDEHLRRGPLSGTVLLALLLLLALAVIQLGKLESAEHIDTAVAAAR